MKLSRFVVTYPDVRPGEHVLYDVLGDRYAGVSGAALDGAGSIEDLRDFCVRDRAEDDERLRAHLDAAAEGVPGQMHVTLMPTLACNLACTYFFQKDSPAFPPIND